MIDEGFHVIGLAKVVEGEGGGLDKYEGNVGEMIGVYVQFIWN